jgi:undecaprenyl diphosphate synthase
MTHVSSTQEIPGHGEVPRHVAIILDGNGRWAKSRRLPRIAGHRRGVEAVRETVRACVERGVEYLTLFAFSSENWRRPADEVALLMQLFQVALSNELDKLHRNGVRLKVVGDTERFDPAIRRLIEQGERLTAENRRLTLTIAANYGGRWDILQALSRLMAQRPAPADRALDESALAPYLAMSYAPEPDLFIRTGGEQRISNFLLWQLAYSELYFTDTLWPDFDAAALDEAFASYRQRERRFGRTGEQAAAAKRAEVA